jgi:hypothetical protein
MGPSSAIQVFTVDDNNGNLADGTPNYNQICPVFSSHSISCPAISLLAFQYPSGRPTLVPVNQTFSFPVNVVGVTGTPQPGTGTLNYRIGAAGSFTSVPMTQGLPNQYTATLPAAPCLSLIQYYLAAQTTTAATQTDPANPAVSVFASIVASSMVTVADLNFQSDPGWTVTNDPSLTTGAWQRAVPILPAPSGCPSADADGSGMCWVTDNRSGNFDVDGGPTTLTTGNYDLSAFLGATVSYSRWFTNATTLDDTLRVDTSADGGTTWFPMDSTGNSVGWTPTAFYISMVGGGPLTSQFRFRFVVSDNPNNSVCEAGIDAFKLVGYTCAAACYANCDASTSAPVLNVADFTCFLQRYANNEPYANCDGSTTAPVLNVADFTCFLTKYAAGCP